MCIRDSPETAACCANDLDPDTSTYCPNSAGLVNGRCPVRTGCGQKYCCAADPPSSLECGPTQHHCNSMCVSLDQPCCPLGSTDPKCGVHLVAGAPKVLTVDPP